MEEPPGAAEVQAEGDVAEQRGPQEQQHVRHENDIAPRPERGEILDDQDQADRGQAGPDHAGRDGEYRNLVRGRMLALLVVHRPLDPMAVHAPVARILSAEPGRSGLRFDLYAAQTRTAIIN